MVVSFPSLKFFGIDSSSLLRKPFLGGMIRVMGPCNSFSVPIRYLQKRLQNPTGGVEVPCRERTAFASQTLGDSGIRKGESRVPAASGTEPV
jgi:hypothetical protein